MLRVALLEYTRNHPPSRARFLGMSRLKYMLKYARDVEKLLTMTCGKSTFPTCLTISNIKTIWNLNFTEKIYFYTQKSDTICWRKFFSWQRKDFILFPIKLRNLLSRLNFLLLLTKTLSIQLWLLMTYTVSLFRPPSVGLWRPLDFQFVFQFLTNYSNS